MENTNPTASAIMTFSEKLEDDSVILYEGLAGKYDQAKDVFLGFAKESKKNKVHLIRTYQETISDALEATFSFEGLEFPEFNFQAPLEEGTDFKDALKMVLEIEEKVPALYSDVAERAQALLATIPRAFSRVAKKRSARQTDLTDLLDKA
jgi:hypothetical protein